jgi:hypothetical protein
VLFAQYSSPAANPETLKEPIIFNISTIFSASYFLVYLLIFNAYRLVMEPLVMGAPWNVYKIIITAGIVLILSLFIPQFLPHWVSIEKEHRD